MVHPTIKDPSPENQLREALLYYFKSRLGGTDEEFQQWYSAINNATQGWKLLKPNSNKTRSINQEYEIPEWFMLAIHATI